MKGGSADCTSRWERVGILAMSWQQRHGWDWRDLVLLTDVGYAKWKPGHMHRWAFRRESHLILQRIQERQYLVDNARTRTYWHSSKSNTTDSTLAFVLTSIAKGPRFCTSLARDGRAPTIFGAAKPRLDLPRPPCGAASKTKHHRGSSPTSSELRCRYGHDDKNKRFLTATRQQHDKPACT